MKRFTLLVLVLLVFAALPGLSKTWVVNKDGLGDFISISQAINMAKPGDVVKVHPGTYNEKVVINKDILVEGSGAENTTISWQEKDYAVEITAGKIRWIRITSSWVGIKSSGGVVTNCIGYNCSSAGIHAYNGGKILHVISLQNQNGFLIQYNETPVITNCISVNNTKYGFAEIYDITTDSYYRYSDYPVEYCNSYGNNINS